MHAMKVPGLMPAAAGNGTGGAGMSAMGKRVAWLGRTREWAHNGVGVRFSFGL